MIGPGEEFGSRLECGSPGQDLTPDRRAGPA